MSDSTDHALQRSLGGLQLITLGAGVIMGVGWAIVLGDWFAAATPLGTMLGMTIGGVLMIAIAACYGEIATALPRTGGDVVYALEIFGSRAAFFVGWFLAMMAIAVTSFEAISIAWFLDVLFPRRQGGIAYVAFGVPVTQGAMTIGLIGIVSVAAVNWYGARSSSRLQDFFTLTKAVAAVSFVVAAAVHGRVENLEPMWTPVRDAPVWHGIAWIAATAPVWFGGFQVVPHAVEELRPETPVRAVALATIATVGIGVLFYSAIAWAAAYSASWRELLQAPLPAVQAVDRAFDGGVGARIVLAAIVLGIIATWNSCFVWATHTLLAMGRLGLAPRMFARLNRHGAPGNAVLFVAAIGALGLFAGRGGTLPILNTASIALACSFFVTCAATWFLRRRQPELLRPFRVPAGSVVVPLAMAIAAAMALIAIVEPFIRQHGWPLEWSLLLAWTTLGAAIWTWRHREERRSTGTAQY